MRVKGAQIDETETWNQNAQKKETHPRVLEKCITRANLKNKQ